MKFIGIIPARYASTRFPAKPLALLGGKPVIQRVYEQVAGVLDEAYVATDDERIEAVVKAFGGKVVMTSIDHKSGTDRCYEAFTKVGQGYDVIVNIQGDEPFIRHSQLEAVKSCFDDASTQIATLVKPFTPEDGFAALENVNSPKVVVNKNMNALYFSRSIIPISVIAESLVGWQDILITSISVSALIVLMRWRVLLLFHNLPGLAEWWNSSVGWRMVIQLGRYQWKWKQWVSILLKFGTCRKILKSAGRQRTHDFQTEQHRLSAS